MSDKSRNFNKLLIWVVPITLLAGGVIFMNFAKKRKPEEAVKQEIAPANVEVITVRNEVYHERLLLPAKIIADREAAVGSELSGKLEAWLIEEGAAVEKDAVIARLNTDDLTAQKEELEVQLASMEASLDFARKESKRVTELFSSQISTQADIDNAEMTLKKAELGVKQIQRALDSLEVRLGKTVFRAPFKGMLETHLVEEGEVVNPGDLLARIYAIEKVRAIVDVPDRFVPFLQKDNPTIAMYINRKSPGAVQDISSAVILPELPKLTEEKTSNEDRLPAEIVRIAQAADPASNTFQVELRTVNPGNALRQGIIARAEVKFLKYPDAIVIPLRAVQVADSGPRVLIAVEQQDGALAAEVRDIDQISIDNDRILIGSGLKAGELLVTAGGKGVLHGDPVKIIVKDDAVQEMKAKPKNVAKAEK